jgi:hypothetical protein
VKSLRATRQQLPLRAGVACGRFTPNSGSYVIRLIEWSKGAISRHSRCLNRASPQRIATGVHAAEQRLNILSIFAAMIKSFSCSPLIFFVCRETVAFPQPKLIFG